MKFASHLSESSRRWLARHAKDPYVKEAKSRGLRSRAALKLETLDQKFGLLKNAHTVIDLGAAPGGWSQIAAERLTAAPQLATTPSAAIIAIDLLPMDPIPGVHFLQADFLEAQEELARLCPKGADLILSDMAPSASGHKQADALRAMNLIEEAWYFAQEHLRPGGHFVTKFLQCGQETQLIQAMRTHFRTIKQVKPDQSRNASREMYLVALGRHKNI